MRRLMMWTVVAGMVIAAWIPAVSEEPGTPPVTLEECVAVALQESPGLKVSERGADAAGEAALSARSAYYPTLGVALGYRRLETRIFFPESMVEALSQVAQGSGTSPFITPVLGPMNQWSTGLRASYTLFDSGQRKAQVLGSEAGRDASRAVSSAVRQDTILQVSKTFFGLLSAKEQEGVARSALARSEDHLRLSQARKEVGAVSKADVLRFQVEVSGARLRLVAAEGAVRVARGSLNTAMGRPAETPLDVVDAPLEAPVPPAPASALASEAISRRPELKASESSVAARERAVDAARGAYGPKVSLDASWGRLDDLWFPDYKDWSVGVALTWPVFTGFARQHNLAKAKLDLQGEKEGARRAELAIRQEVWEARSRLEESIQAVETAKVLREEADESLRVTRERYAEGAGTVSDLLDAETSLQKADSSLVQSRNALAIAQVQLKRAVGAL
jgi:outer membrane protein TolC